MGLEGKFKSKFLLVLALITIVTLVISALKDFGIIDLNIYLSAIISILLGAGLLLEANVRIIAGVFTKSKKFDIPQVIHIATAVLGLIVLVAGVLSLLGMAIPTQAQGVVGVVKSIAVFAVVIEYFV